MEDRYVTRVEQVALTVDHTQVAIRFREPAPQTVRRKIALDTPGMGPPVERFEIPGEKYTVFSVQAGEQDPADVRRAATAALERNPSVARVAPVYLAGPNSMVATDRVMVGVKREAVAPVKRLEEMGFQVLEQHGTAYVVRLREHDDPVQVASELALHADVEYAEPDFVEYGTLLEPGLEEPVAPHAPGDPLASSQWGRRLTRADEAMGALPGRAGNPAIRIAILDSGVDRQHPDLDERIVGVYDAADSPPKENPQDADFHGTACAGLAAAIPNNDEGIRGFGGGCSILAVRIYYTSQPSGVCSISNSAIVRGIEWAVRNGADVLSLSWNTVHAGQSVASAIEHALTLGRGGRGCVVVAGTGNDNRNAISGVKFPASLPGVVAVAATNDLDEPVNRESDGTGWASAGGREVALAAPGVRQWTTDNTGKLGIHRVDPPPGHYTGRFQGTSAATAIVAGAAGLVLSAKPALTGGEVRDILCSTAEKVSTVTYQNGHSERLGAGRLDLQAAVEKALKP